MSKFTFALMIFSMFTVIYGIGIFTGVSWERIRWNRLIEKGVIPKPERKEIK